MTLAFFSRLLLVNNPSQAYDKDISYAFFVQST